MSESARILVLDDDPAMLEATARVLRDAGYEVGVVATGAECLEAAADFLPDLVLLDVVLPDCDGVELCSRLKAAPGLWHTHVILMSGLLCSSEDQARGLEQGADGYIARPVSNRELVARVKAAIRLQQTEKALRVDEAEFRAIFEDAGIGCTLMEPDGRLVRANAAFCEMVGRTEDELLGAGLGAITHPDDAVASWEFLESMLRGERDRGEMEKRYLRPDGQVVWAHINRVLARYPDGKPRHFISHIQDITARKDAEREVMRLNRMLSMLSDVNQAVVRASDEAQVYDDVCRIAVARGGFRLVAVILTETRADGLYVSCVARSGDEGHLEYGALPLEEAGLCAPALDAIKTGSAICLASADDAMGEGYAAVGACSLTFQETVMGCLVFHSDDPGHFGQDEVRILTEMAGDVSYAVRNIRRNHEKQAAVDALRQSEARYHSIFAQTAVGIALTGLDGRHHDCNQALLDMLGLTREEFLSMRADEFTHPEDRDAPPTLWRELEEGLRSSYQREVRYIHRDGHVVWARLTVSFALDAHGHRTAVITIVEDITARKQAEAALAQSEERHRTLIQAVPDIIAEVDEHLQYRWMNAAGLQFFGADAIGRNATEFMVGEAAALDTLWAVRPLLTGAMESGRVESLQRRQDGAQRLLEWHCRPLRNEDGAIIGALSVAHDITERRRAEREITRLNRLLATLSDANKAIVRGTSEEELFQDVCRIAVERGGFLLAAVSMVAEDGDEVLPVASFGRDDGFLALRRVCLSDPQRNVGSVAQAILAGRPETRLWTLESYAVPPWREAARARGFEAVGSFPLRRDGQVVGTLDLYADGPEYFQHEERELLEELAADLSFAMDAFMNQRRRQDAEDALLREQAQIRATLYSIGDAVISTDLEGRVVRMNPPAETLTGWSEAEAIGRHIQEVFHIVNEETRELVENPVTRVLREGTVVGLANHTTLISREGREYPIADAAAPIAATGEGTSGVVLVFRDQTDERLAQRRMRLRLEIIQGAVGKTKDELVALALESMRAMLGCGSACFYLVEPDQRTVRLVGCSSGTDARCLDQWGEPGECESAKASPWADCIRDRCAVVRNEHPLGRELLVPVVRDDRVVAMLGVSNSTRPYTESDVATASYLADVTWQLLEQKRAEEELVASETRYRRLFETSQDGVLIVEPATGLIVDANPSAHELLGFALGTLVDKPLSEVHPLADAVSFPELLETVGRDGVCHCEPGTIRTQDGREIDVQLSCSCFDAGDTRVVQCNVRNVTELHRAQDSARLATVGQLAAGVAHDFNNILSSMMLRAEMAKLAPSQDGYRALTEAVLSAGARGAEICRNLMSFARPEAPHRAALQIETAIDAAIAVHEPYMEATGVRVCRDYAPDPRPVQVDVGQMEQVFLNLVINACHAMPSGGEIRVTTRYDTSANEVAISFADTGCGIPPENLSRVFEPFFTTKGRLGESDVQGSGLGLSVSHGTITAHGGTISVQSEVGRGTTFEIRLPLEAVPRTTASGQPPAKTAVLARVEHCNILAMDDDREYLAVLGRALAHRGIRIVAVDGVDAAMEALAANEFALILADVRMPDGGASELLHRLRQSPHKAPVVAISAASSTPLTESILNKGALACIQKPTSLADMVHIIEEHVAQYAAVQSQPDDESSAPKNATNGQTVASILIAEDEEEVRQTAMLALSLEGYRVTGEGETDAAIAALRREEFALVIADMMMPGGGAQRILQALVEMGNATPVIVATGRLEQSLVEELRAEGAAAVLHKPFTLRKLISLVAEVLDAGPPRI